MGLMDFFRRQPPSAQVAKERLRIIVAQERGARGSPDYLPLLRRELLEVIRKYVNVDPEAVVINLERDQGHEVLELSVALPDKIPRPPRRLPARNDGAGARRASRRSSAQCSVLAHLRLLVVLRCRRARSDPSCVSRKSMCSSSHFRMASSSSRAT